MAPGSNGPHENTSPNNVVDDKNRTPRHPRWTRQETLVLSQGKNFAEERGRRGRRSSSMFGPDPLEPKWDFISAHCREHGTNRGPVQCRKRWSNMISDFKKIRTWENEVAKEGGSYWTMRSDLRRERRLPGFFDREVYDVLDGKTCAQDDYQLVVAMVSGEDGLDDLDGEDEDEEHDDDSILEENGSGQDKGKGSMDGKRKNIPSPVPISEMRYQPFHHGYSDQGTGSRRQPSPHFCRGCESHEGVKRRRQSSDDGQNVNEHDQLMKALERNTSLLSEGLEAQRLNYQMDREQRNEQHASLITALNKINDALEKIANKP